MRDKQFKILLTNREHRMLEQLAKQLGMSMADVVRIQIREVCRVNGIKL